MTELVRQLNERLGRIRARLSKKEEAILMKRLSLLIRSGMSVPDALRSLSGDRRRSRALSAIASAVDGGTPLSDAFASESGFVSPFSIEAIRVGEATGMLAENLSYLSTELENQARFKSKLAGALAYPVLLAFLTILISMGLILFIFPKVVPLFGSLGASLPLPTRMMLALSGYLSEWGIVTLVTLLALVAFSWVAFARIPRLSVWRAKAALRTPVLGNLLSSYRLATFARSLGLLLTSGTPLPEALRSAGNATGNILCRDALSRAAHRIEEGNDVRGAFQAERRLFPGLVLDILSAGEASGGLAEASFHLASYYENEFEEATRRLSVMVEPVLMIFMGLVVGFVAISMILPIYAITDHLRAK